MSAIIRNFVARFKGDPPPLDLVDFPTQLRVSLTADELAKTLYKVSRECWGTPRESWEGQRTHERRAFEEAARQIILWMKPQKMEPHAHRLYRFANRLQENRKPVA